MIKRLLSIKENVHMFSYLQKIKIIIKNKIAKVVFIRKQQNWTKLSTFTSEKTKFVYILTNGVLFWQFSCQLSQ